MKIIKKQVLYKKKLLVEKMQMIKKQIIYKEHESKQKISKDFQKLTPLIELFIKIKMKFNYNLLRIK